MKRYLLFLLVSTHTIVVHAQVITTITGNGSYSSSGDGGAAISGTVNQPWNVASDKLGNIYIVESYRIRKINASGIITTFAGTGTGGYNGDNGPATNAQISEGAITCDYSDNVYIAGGGHIRRITPAGIITTVAGTGAITSSGDGGPATAADMYVTGIAIDKAGNIYITDITYNRIRKINTSGIINNYAGTGVSGGFSGDGGPATAAELYLPMRIAVDSIGNVYTTVKNIIYPGGGVALKNAIRKIDTFGIITTITGNGSNLHPDGGPATAAFIGDVTGIVIDTKGNIFFSDACRLREVNRYGIIGTIAGNDYCGFSGDGGSSYAAQLHSPYGVATDLAGNIYIADRGNNRIRKITAPTAINNVNALPGSIALYPNPVQEDGVVNVSGVGSSTIRLYNILGQHIATAYNTDNISLAACPAGIYLVRIFTPKGELLHQGKVVKE